MHANAPELSRGAECELLNQTAWDRRRLQLLVRLLRSELQLREASGGNISRQASQTQKVERALVLAADEPTISMRVVPSERPQRKQGWGVVGVDEVDAFGLWNHVMLDLY